MLVPNEVVMGSNKKWLCLKELNRDVNKIFPNDATMDVDVDFLDFGDDVFELDEEIDFEGDDDYDDHMNIFDEEEPQKPIRWPMGSYLAMSRSG